VMRFFTCDEKSFYKELFSTSASPAFLESWKSQLKENYLSEEQIFTDAGVNYIPAFLRDDAFHISSPVNTADLLKVQDIKGLIHSHSNWSDGGYSLEDMCKELIRLGFEYLVISDHSKAAFYANGLSEERIIEQHKQIDELNKKLAPFKIFKSIECDILNDGSLDYDNSVLAKFDLVITSIHSNQDMDQEKAMKRLLGAITNPYTTILGHMTGRLLLRRKGYPVDYETIIDACAQNKVVIEINANPNRLDIDWRWVRRAREKNVMLSVNPDAHTTDEFHNIKYGVLVAQKGGLTAAGNLSSYSLKDFENYLKEIKTAKGIL
jgi:DNA polymerase (family X)